MYDWVAFFALIGAVTLWMSRSQPFPEVSARYAWLLLFIAGLLAISTQSPRATDTDVPRLLAAGFGGIGVIIGVRSTSITRTDVILAPFAGFLLCAGTIALLTAGWGSYQRTEQIVGFLLVTFLVLGQLFLTWKGLIIGVTGITWSKAALRQLERGLIDGPRGAIEMFDRSWNMEDDWLNVMSHSALAAIHNARGDADKASMHEQRLARLGGEEMVDETWRKKIAKCLRKVAQSHSEE